MRCCLARCLLLLLLVSAPSYRREGHRFALATAASPPAGSLAEKLRAMRPEDLKQLLRHAGYAEADVGRQTQPTALVEERHLARSCEQVIMFTSNHDVVGQPDTLPDSFVELDEQLNQHLYANRNMQGHRDAAPGFGSMMHQKNLDCTCDQYKCQCRKQCFCKLKSDTFGGTQVGEEESRQAGVSGNPDRQFKCTCSFEGVGGGAGIGSGGTMDCDCKVADCACEKQCLCSSPQELSQELSQDGSSQQRFKQQEPGQSSESASDAQSDGGPSMDDDGGAVRFAGLDSPEDLTFITNTY